MTTLFEAPGYVEVDDPTAFMADKPVDEIADKDYIDAQTGEVIWEKGEAAGMTPYHPNAAIRKEEERRRRDAEWEQERLEWDSEYQLDRAINQFVSNFGPDPDLGAAPEDAAPDMAETFFLDYPNWQDWADDLELSKWEIKERVADRIYSVLLGEE